MATQLSRFTVTFFFLVLCNGLPDEQICGDMEEPNRFILCYNNGLLPAPHVDTCRCSHLVVSRAANTDSNNGTFPLDEALVKMLQASGSKTGYRLRRILSLSVTTENFSSASVQTIGTYLTQMIDSNLIEGVEINWQRPTIDENSKKDKADLLLFMKELHVALQGNVTTTSFLNYTHINRSIYREVKNMKVVQPVIILRLPSVPEMLVKGFDLKPLARIVDLFVINTHNLPDSSNVTYHHSRLMGISDILNTDSVLDLATSLGVPNERVVAAVPTFAVRFSLRDVQQNLPGSPTSEYPIQISKGQMCSVMNEGNWTVERDDDLTGTYAYSSQGEWISFDDDLASKIKAKYFLLRDIAGVALIPADTDDSLMHQCQPNPKELPITQVYYEQFSLQESNGRTRRQLAKSLREDLTSADSTASSSIYNENIRPSPYRIVRIVSRSGETIVMRQALESNLQCSRQGYYRHPEDCGRFYRCVKFDQYVDDFTVFEYDCPEGLVFDERWEVCTWPSQAAPCGGSSEIRPVPVNRFVCPGEGYFADPENCRWFFACRDYAKDGSTFTQYEFRCPFGLLFDEKNLVCDWPWLVPQCSKATPTSSSTKAYDLVRESKEEIPKGIPIGSPGYLSGKLVTGEGLYKDPRPAHYSESVVSAGCLNCHSAGLTIREPLLDKNSNSKNTLQQSKLVLAIPAASIANETDPVRIIVATTTRQSSGSEETASLYDSRSPLDSSVSDVNRVPSVPGLSEFFNSYASSEPSITSFGSYPESYAPSSLDRPSTSEPPALHHSYTSPDHQVASGLSALSESPHSAKPSYSQTQTFGPYTSSGTRDSNYSVSSELAKSSDVYQSTGPTRAPSSYVSPKPYTRVTSEMPVSHKPLYPYESTKSTSALVESSGLSAQIGFLNDKLGPKSPSSYEPVGLPVGSYEPGLPGSREYPRYSGLYESSISLATGKHSDSLNSYENPSPSKSKPSSEFHGVHMQYEHGSKTTVTLPGSNGYNSFNHYESSTYLPLNQPGTSNQQPKVQVESSSSNDFSNLRGSAVNYGSDSSRVALDSSNQFEPSGIKKPETFLLTHSTLSPFESPDSSIPYLSPVLFQLSPEGKPSETFAAESLNPFKTLREPTESVFMNNPSSRPHPYGSDEPDSSYRNSNSYDSSEPIIKQQPPVDEKTSLPSGYLGQASLLENSNQFQSNNHESKKVASYGTLSTYGTKSDEFLQASTRNSTDEEIGVHKEPLNKMYSKDSASETARRKSNYHGSIGINQKNGTDGTNERNKGVGTGRRYGIGGTGGRNRIGGTGGRNGAGGRGGSGGSGSTGYAGPPGLGAMGLSGSDYNSEWDGPNGDIYSKNIPSSTKSTSSTSSLHQDNYKKAIENSGSTFGLKDSAKIKDRLSTTLLLGNKYSTLSTNSDEMHEKNAPREDTNNRSSIRIDQNNRSSNKNSKIKSPALVSIESTTASSSTSQNDYLVNRPNADYSPTSSALRNRNKLVPSISPESTHYGDKKVNVKVPSTNKASLLDKWVTVPSQTSYEQTIVPKIDSHQSSENPPSTSTEGGLNSNKNLKLKGRLIVRPKNPSLSSEVESTRFVTISHSTSSLQNASNNNNSKGQVTNQIASSQYGKKYLERITVAHATANNITLGPEVCVRAGLFRHPSDCQKFYECYWDRWINQYTVHIFKCPVHLVYDDFITACNWPMDGPACTPHEAVKLYTQPNI